MDFATGGISGGFYGAGMAGGRFDPIAFIQRPPIIIRAVCWLFSIIVFGSIASNGYMKDENEKDVCIINGNGSVCSYTVWAGLVAFFASMAFIAGEYLFEQMSSAKSRKHYVVADLGFSAFLAFLYFVGFCYISSQWSKSPDPPNGVGSGNVTCAILFSFLSVFTWGGCAYFAFLRYKAGVTEIPFQSTYESDPNNQAAYTSYANDNEQYQEPPFSQQQMGGQQQFQAPTY
ncbi:CLUMA_CG020488, isoform A [Clunio marinus]|uniref:Synaptogyrin n=1 Tax=Clunio marinus TaxID=568069 RepID=A0A1J1J536_9DIPT|nr:CLUMA_CG020488, isoform A [Clunio marinus]